MYSIMEEERIAPRIAILDARELDNAIFDILKSQTNLVANYVPPWIWNNYGPELDTVLKFGIWKLSVEKNRATFGQQLLRLKYSKDSNLINLKLLALLTIGGPYLKEKLLNSTYNSNQNHLRKICEVLEKIETSIKALNVLTFVRFLWRGGAPSFLELVLCLTPVSVIPQSKRNVGYSFMTRELIWHGFIELLVILLPFINYHRLKRKIKSIFSSTTIRPIGKKKHLFTFSTLCDICREAPILPYQMGCNHVFCYLCISSNHAADQMFECPSCGFSNPDKNAIKPIQLSVSFHPSSEDFSLLSEEE